jgi:hypothetical protein
MNFEQMANRVTENVDGGPPQFDVAILFMIIEVLQNIAPILQDFCNKKPEDVVKAARKKRRRDKRVVKLETIRVMGRRGFRKDGGEEIVDGVFTAVAKSTPGEIAELYSQA